MLAYFKVSDLSGGNAPPSSKVEGATSPSHSIDYCTVYTQSCYREWICAVAMDLHCSTES